MYGEAQSGPGDPQTLAAGELPAGGSPPALPAGYTPIPERSDNGTTIADGITEAETQTLTRKPRVELPEDDEILNDEPAASGNTISTSTRDKPLTKPQATKLNVLVGTLRDGGAITTEQLWAAVAKERGVEAAEMIELLHGMSGDDLHWSPLRSSLTRAEATGLIERLQALEEKVAAA